MHSEYDADFEGDEKFFPARMEKIQLPHFFFYVQSIPWSDFTYPDFFVILILWDKVLTKKASIFQPFPGPLAAVIIGK